MITVPELAADALGSFLSSEMKRAFGSSDAQLTELVPSVARLALECIGNSDALYHNVEHTMLVTLAGRDILRGRALLKPQLAGDYAHLIVACLLHDIGYVRGIIKGDDADGYVVDAAGGKAPTDSERARWVEDIELFYLRAFFSGGPSSNRGYPLRGVGPHGIVPFFNPGVAAQMFETLSAENVNIEMISTSTIRISCVVRERDVARAVQALHRAFELETT